MPAARYQLHALTIRRPWDWVISRGPMRIENRRWPPPAWLIGKPLAIHGGKQWDRPGWSRLRLDHKLVVPYGDQWTGGISAVVTVTGVVEQSDDPWFRGPYGWILDDVVPIDPPLPCRGHRKLWRVREPLLTTVRQRYREGRAAAQ